MKTLYFFDFKMYRSCPKIFTHDLLANRVPKLQIVFCVTDLQAMSEEDTTTSDSDSDDEFMETFIDIMIKTQMRKRRERRKRRLEQSNRSRAKKKRGGKLGRRWKQRKAGQIRPQDFTWWRLINKPDVGDVNSKNGKVIIACVCNYNYNFEPGCYSFSCCVIIVCR